jgi:hypothetical protein
MWSAAPRIKGQFMMEARLGSRTITAQRRLVRRTLIYFSGLAKVQVSMPNFRLRGGFARQPGNSLPVR